MSESELHAFAQAINDLRRKVEELERAVEGLSQAIRYVPRREARAVIEEFLGSASEE